MRQADIHVGHDYTLEPSSHAGTPRLRVLTQPAGGRVWVQVIEADPRHTYRNDYTVDEEVEVNTRALHQTWETWAAGAADRAAARQARERRAQEEQHAREVARRDQVACDPNRPLPAHYEDQHAYTAEELYGDHLTRPHELLARQLQPFADLMTHWPPTLRRDVLAAATTEHDEPYAENTVGAVMGDLARLLHQGPATSQPSMRPAHALPAAFDAFVQALAAESASAGTRLVQPWAPTPSSPDSALPQQGWLQVRVAHAESSTYLHTPTCSTLRNHRTGPYTSYPWWQVAILGHAAACCLCKGPDLSNAREVAHAMLAASVWDARGRTHIEAWQRVAFAQLVGATLAEQAAAGQQPRNKADRVLAKLATRPLTRKETHRVLNWLFDGAWDEVDEVASRLASQRLNVAFKALPKDQRPAKVPVDVTADAVRRHLDTLRGHGPFRDPYLLLFGDPHAW